MVGGVSPLDVHLGCLHCYYGLFHLSERVHQIWLTFDQPALNHEGNFVLLRLINKINRWIGQLAFHKQVALEGNVEKGKSLPHGVVVDGKRAFLRVYPCHLLIHDCEGLFGAHDLPDIDIFKACLQVKELEYRAIPSVIPSYEAFNEFEGAVKDNASFKLFIIWYWCLAAKKTALRWEKLQLFFFGEQRVAVNWAILEDVVDKRRYFQILIFLFTLLGSLQGI